MGYKILLIDDEADILEFVKYNLEKDGYEVHTATNGAEGLQVAQTVNYHNQRHTKKSNHGTAEGRAC